MEYNLEKSLYIQLFADFMDYNFDDEPYENDSIWDLNIIKYFEIQNRYNTELYFTGHNIFNGYQYEGGYNINPERWVEIGVRFKF